MPEPRAFQKLQLEFTQHIRRPDQSPAPEGIEDRRMAIYRELFYNNVEGLLTSSFPVLRKLLPKEHWHRLVREYFATHEAHTPLFLEIPQEFLRYLQEEHQTHPDDPPFLLELAHYEWVELAINVLEDDTDHSGIDPAGDLLTGVPVVAVAAWTLAYSYPVHRIGPDYQPDAPDEQPTFIVVWRDEDDSVQFMLLNPVTARLLELLDRDEQRSGEDVLRQIAGELGQDDPTPIIANGAEALAQLRSRNIILGTQQS